MTVRRLIRRCSRKPRRSFRKSFRRRPKSSARSSSRTVARPARLRPVRSKRAKIPDMKKALGSSAFFAGRLMAAKLTSSAAGSVQRRIARAIAAGLVLDENLGDLGMADRLAGIVRHQVLLGDI